MTKYEDLCLLPWAIAETLCERPYTAIEYSERKRDQILIQQVEAKRIRNVIINSFRIICFLLFYQRIQLR